MRGLAIALFLAALPPAAQEDARIRDLVQKLEDDRYEVRDESQKELVRLGEAALPLLRKAFQEAGEEPDRGELRVRAQAAIRQIELDVKARAVYRDPKPVTLRVSDARLSEVAADLARQTGLKVDATAVDGDAPVTLDLRDAPLFRVLDELCRGRDDRTYEYREEGIVKLLREPHVAYPTGYAGPFRMRVLSLKMERSTDFKSKTASLQLGMDAEAEKYLKPTKHVEIALTRAQDDRGGALELKDEDLVQGMGGRVVMGGAVVMRAWAMAGGGPGLAPPPKSFTLGGLSAGASRITLQGTARFCFPLESREIRLAKPDSGPAQDTSDYLVKIEPQGGRRWNVTFRRKKPAEGGGGGLIEDVEQRLDLDSLAGIDEDGAEHKGLFQPSRDTMAARIRVVNNRVVQEMDTIAFLAQFPTLKAKSLKELRFRFADATFVKSVPFTIEGIELP
jgi:hypothetical protein